MNTVAVRPGWAERHATEFPAVKPVAAPADYEAPSDPWGTQPMPVVPFEDDPDNKIAPGTRAAIEQQRAADVIDESRAPWHAHRPSSPTVGYLCLFAITFCALFAIWLFHGMPHLWPRLPDIGLIAIIAGVCLLPIAAIKRTARHLRDKDGR